MKIIQYNKNTYGAEEADEPPAVNDDLALDVEDQKMIEKGDGQNADDKANGYQRTMCMPDDSNDKGDEDKQRYEVEKMEQGTDIEKTNQLATPDILRQVGLDGKDR